jgi:hypothetical protein
VIPLLRHAKKISEAELEAMPLFARFARWVERQVGRSSTFLLAIAVVVLWAASGPIFGFRYLATGHPIPLARRQGVVLSAISRTSTPRSLARTNASTMPEPVVSP